MSQLDIIQKKVAQLPEDLLSQLIFYIEFLEFQQEQDQEGLRIAKQRSKEIMEGNVQPVDAKTFWNSLQQRLNP